MSIAVHHCTLARRVIAALLCLFIAGCANDFPPKVQTVEIAVPVPTPRVCPVELCAPLDHGPLPVFRPGEGDDVVLDAEGQARLRDLLANLKGRFEALRAWAVAP
jgi:hypothetical protein